MADALYMVFDESQNAVDLLKGTDKGFESRDNQQWYSVPDGSDIHDDMDFVPVQEDFIQLFDKLASKGKEPTYRQAQQYASPADRQDSETE